MEKEQKEESDLIAYIPDGRWKNDIPAYDYGKTIHQRDNWEPNRSKIPYDTTRL